MQRLLLDTHTLLWAIEDNPSLNAIARSAIVDPNNDVFVSAASVWEISIKRSLGRLEAPANLGEEVRKAGFIELPVTIRHGELAARLPPHHGDPFDRDAGCPGPGGRTRACHEGSGLRTVRRTYSDGLKAGPNAPLTTTHASDSGAPAPPDSPDCPASALSGRRRPLSPPSAQAPASPPD